MNKPLGILSILILLGVLVFTSGCGYTKISDIQNNPGEYEGKEVSISGTTTESFWISIVSTGAYQIDDGSGTIWVITKQTPPEKGNKASSKGTVATGIKIGERSFGIVINETSQ
jgi:hypothetical protein